MSGIFAHDDQRAVEFLTTLSDCRAPLRDIRQAYDGLLKLVDKKGVKVAGGKRREKGPDTRTIASRLGLFCSQAVLPSDCVPSMFAAVSSSNPKTRPRPRWSCCRRWADAWPLMLASSVEELYALLQLKDDPEKVVAALRILSFIDFSTANIKHSLSNRLEAVLKQHALSGRPDVVRYAIRAIKAVFTEHTGGAVKTVNKLKLNVDLGDDVREDKADALLHGLFTHYLDHLSLTEQHLEAVLVGMGEVSSYYPRMWLIHREAIIAFLLKELFLASLAQYQQCVLRAIEAMTAFLCSLALTENAEGAVVVGRKLMGIYVKGIINRGVISKHRGLHQRAVHSGLQPSRRRPAQRGR